MSAVRNRIRQILQDEINMGSSMVGSGYGTHQGALKGWATRRAHMGMGEGFESFAERSAAAKKGWARRRAEMGMGEGYGTHEGALKGWQTRRAHGKGFLPQLALAAAPLAFSGIKKLLGLGYGTSKGAKKGWATRRAHMGMGIESHAQRVKAARHNPWLQFLAEFRANNPHLSGKVAAQEASVMYRQQGLASTPHRAYKSKRGMGMYY